MERDEMAIREVSVFVENRPGRLAEIARTLARSDVDIRALSIADTSGFGILRLIVDKPARALDVLTREGFAATEGEVVAIEVADKPGGLAHVLELLVGGDVEVEYVYAFSRKPGGTAIVIVKPSNCDKAVRILSESDLRLVGEDEIYDI